MIIGLYKQLADGNRRLENLRSRAGDANSTPQVRHVCEVDADELQKTLVGIEFAIHENQEQIRTLTGLLNQLVTSPHKSRHRSLAITLLEDAQSRLLRELGDKPENDTGKPNAPAGAVKPPFLG